MRDEELQNLIRITDQAFERDYARYMEHLATLSVEEIMHLLEAAGEVVERALLEVAMDNGGIHPALDSAFVLLPKVTILGAVFDHLIIERRMPGDEFVDRLTRLDQEKVEWVYETLLKLLRK
jgi:hypothetical protein